MNNLTSNQVEQNKTNPYSPNQLKPSVQIHTQGIETQEPTASPLQSAGYMNTPAPQNIPTSVVTTTKKRSSFPLAILGLILVAAIIYLGVAYLYLGNKKVKDQIKNEQLLPQVPPTQGVSSTSGEVKVVNGSIYRVTLLGKETLLIRKEEYPESGITGFFRVIESADKEKICFESVAPAPKPALYYSFWDGGRVVKVGDNYRNCIWSTKGDKIAFTDNTSQDTPTNIFVYDLLSDQKTNITNISTSSGIIRRYEPVKWLENDSNLSCIYEEINLSDTTIESQGKCEINLITGQIKDI